MRITKGGAPGVGEYFTVDFGPREFVTYSGKVIPYGFAVGTIREENGKVIAQLWRPAASTPRDYKPAALAALREAAITKFGRVDKVRG